MIPFNFILRSTGELLATLTADKLADFLRPRRLLIVGVGEGPRDLLVDYESAGVRATAVGTWYILNIKEAAWTS